ncbi:hypothetical protein [Afipia sp. GAS231]|uniref:hypothetical protein n=1 Tax=Afipia sp. GAS231 TaxID=1882747 RepID=UPI00087D2E17|nr:hypothetical protein [Afipia sp. GAS231]SDO63915.1 hypothetical protein SAMN05444050_4633 [Afipia sp. GAS231]
MRLAFLVSKWPRRMVLVERCNPQGTRRRCKSERDVAQVAFDRALAETRPEARITQEKIAEFVEVTVARWLTVSVSSLEVSSVSPGFFYPLCGDSNAPNRKIDPGKNLSHIPNGITSVGTGLTCLGIYAT